MAKYKGIDCAVKISGTPDVSVLEMASWTLDEKADVAGEDALAFGEVRASALMVTKLTATGSVEGFCDNTDTTGQIAIRTAYLAGTSLVLELYETATKYFSMTAFITGYNVSVTREGFNKLAFTFAVQGAPTRA